MSGSPLRGSTMFSNVPSPRSRVATVLSLGFVSILFVWVMFGNPQPEWHSPNNSLSETVSPSAYKLPQHDFAYAAFLAAPEEEMPNDDDDKYFVATRILAHQLLWDPKTRTNSSIPFLVLVTEDVAESKRRRLTLDGATIVPVGKISFDWMQASRKRWRDVLSKLHLFTMVQYKRILFLDSDILIVRPMDGIFTDPASEVQTNKGVTTNTRDDEGPQPPSYVFGGVSGQGGYKHPWPPRKGNACNAGFILLRPSQELFEHYLSVAAIPDRFDSKYPEQNLWIYVHRRDGNMPWQQLDPAWNVNWATMEDYRKGAASLHTKWWDAGPEQDLRDLGWSMRWKMQGSSEARDAALLRNHV